MSLGSLQSWAAGISGGVKGYQGAKKEAEEMALKRLAEARMQEMVANDKAFKDRSLDIKENEDMVENPWYKMGNPTQGQGMTAPNSASGFGSLGSYREMSGLEKGLSALGPKAHKSALSAFVDLNKPRDPSMMAFRAEDKLDREIERLGGSVNESPGARAAAPMRTLNQETNILASDTGNIDRSKLPGTFTNMVGALPFVGEPLANAMSKTYDGQKVRQSALTLLNAQIKFNSGTAASKYEEARNLIQMGMSPGGDENNLIDGIRMANEAINENDKTIRASHTPLANKVFTERGGTKPYEQMIQNSDPLEEELRRRGL